MPGHKAGGFCAWALAAARPPPLGSPRPWEDALWGVLQKQLSWEGVSTNDTSSLPERRSPVSGSRQGAGVNPGQRGSAQRRPGSPGEKPSFWAAPLLPREAAGQEGEGLRRERQRLRGVGTRVLSGQPSAERRPALESLTKTVCSPDVSPPREAVGRCPCGLCLPSSRDDGVSGAQRKRVQGTCASLALRTGCPTPGRWEGRGPGGGPCSSLSRGSPSPVFLH